MSPRSDRHENLQRQAPTRISLGRAVAEPANTDFQVSSSLPTIPAPQWIERELARPEEPWLIHRMVLPGGLTIVAGKPKLGKSFLSALMAMCMSSGRTVGPIKPVGRVKSLYLDLEGSARMTAQRLRLLARGHDLRESDLDLMTICDRRDFQVLQQGNAALLGDTIKKEGIQVVFLDTVARSFAGDENSKKEVQKYLDVLSELRNSLGVAVVLVHHLSKSAYAGRDVTTVDPGGGLRGSGAFEGAFDVIFSLNEGYVEGEHLRFMASSGKYTDEWHCAFHVTGEKDAEGEFISSKLVFGSRVDGRVEVCGVAPLGSRPGGHNNLHGKQGLQKRNGSNT